MGRRIADIFAKHGITVSENVLAHAGVKGMKWGKRKARKAEAEAERIKVRDMSDDELKSKINRIKLEKEYTSLTSPQVNAGKKVVGGILLTVGSQLAKEYVTAKANQKLYGNVGGLKAAVAAAEAAAKK